MKKKIINNSILKKDKFNSFFLTGYSLKTKKFLTEYCLSRKLIIIITLVFSFLFIINREVKATTFYGTIGIYGSSSPNSGVSLRHNPNAICSNKLRDLENQGANWSVTINQSSNTISYDNAQFLSSNIPGDSFVLSFIPPPCGFNCQNIKYVLNFFSTNGIERVNGQGCTVNLSNQQNQLDPNHDSYSFDFSLNKSCEDWSTGYDVKGCSGDWTIPADSAKCGDPNDPNEKGFCYFDINVMPATNCTDATPYCRYYRKISCVNQTTGICAPSSCGLNGCTLNIPTATPTPKLCSEIAPAGYQASCSNLTTTGYGCGTTGTTSQNVCYYNINVTDSRDCPPTGDTTNIKCRYYQRIDCPGCTKDVNCKANGCTTIPPSLRKCDTTDIGQGYDVAMCSSDSISSPTFSCGPTGDPSRRSVCYYDLHVTSTNVDCPANIPYCRYYNRRDCFDSTGNCNSNICTASGCNITPIATPTLPPTITSNTIIIEFVDSFPRTCAEIKTANNRDYSACAPPLIPPVAPGCGTGTRNNICYYNTEEADSSDCQTAPDIKCRYYDRRICGWDSGTCTSQCGTGGAAGCNLNMCESLTVNPSTIYVDDSVTVSSSFTGYGEVHWGKCPDSNLNCRVVNSSNPQLLASRNQGPINNTFIITNPGRYVFETNTYDTPSCNSMCSTGGAFYRNSDLAAGCSSTLWELVEGLKCNSNCGVKYLQVNPRGGPTNPPATQPPAATDTPIPPSPIPSPTSEPAMPTAIITPTINPNSPLLKLKINFFGVWSQPNNPTGLDYQNQPVKISLKTTGLTPSIVFTRGDVNFRATTAGSYENPENVATNIPAGTYHLLIKGPKHLQKKYKNLNLTAGLQILDFTSIENSLPGGDLPLPQNNDFNNLIQDGKVNSQDYAFIVNNFNKTETNILAVADLNLDGIINTGDTAVLAATLAEKLDEDE